MDFNLWFRFQKENWTKSSELETGAWNWYIFDFLEKNKRSRYTIDLTRNTAQVKQKRWLTWPEALDPEAEKVWLSYERHINTASFVGDNHDLNDDEYLDLKLQLSHRTRELDVRYPSTREAFSELGGSWEFA